VPDRALLDAARSGDRAALDALVTRYEPHVYRFGMTMCHDEDDARDVLQDTLLAMVRSLKSFRADSSLSTWLYAIAHHACLKRRRRRSSAPRRVESLDTLDEGERERLSASGPTPENAAEASETQAALAEAIRGLDPGQRSILLLRDVEGVSAAAVAEALGLSVAAVKSRLHRARVAVRAAMAPRLGRPPLPTPAVTPDCPDVLTVLSRHLEGDLSAQDCAAMEAHVERCSSCRAACASLRQVLAMCRASPVPDVPAAIRDRLRRAIGVCLATETPTRDVSHGPVKARLRPRQLRATRSS
jgi:RNA polymerase sigma-70 factor (ECF subfamily)